jgi:hypothetical protein
MAGAGSFVSLIFDRSSRVSEVYRCAHQVKRPWTRQTVVLRIATGLVPFLNFVTSH